MNSSRTKVTRYLCAAAHLNPTFAKEVKAELLGRNRRAIAASPGVDLVLVARHCIVAQRRRLVRNILLLMVAAIGILIGRGAWLGVCLVFWGVVFSERCIARYEIVAQHLLADRPLPEVAKPYVWGRLATALEGLAREQDGNLTIFSPHKGNAPPFVGAGTELGNQVGWNLTIPVDKGKRGEDGAEKIPKSFEVIDLYRYIDEALKRTLISDSGVELSLEDQLFIDARDVDRSERIFFDRSRKRLHANVDRVLVEAIINKPMSTLRHFRVIRLISWDGQLVLSVFLHIRKLGEALHVEAHYYAMMPLKSVFTHIDHIPNSPTFGDIRWLLVDSVRESGRVLRAAIFSPITVPESIASALLRAASLYRIRSRQGVRLWTALRRSGYLWGALTSIRKRASVSEVTRWYQGRDLAMYVKIVERRLLDSIVSFLDKECDVDTSQLVRQQNFIINQGLQMSGGTIEVTGAMAVGSHAIADSQLLDSND
jgi:hypothetical protein